jgi:glycosyltransferase involved in cell wall biosynthesis
MTKVSIITVSRNCRDRIEGTLCSALSQKDVDVELIVIDGASTDGTCEVIRRYGDRLGKFVSEPDGGIYSGMNKGLALATGEVVAFLNAGDIYADDHVLSYAVAALESGGFDAVFGDLAYIDPRKGRMTRFWTAGPYVPGSFSWGWVPPHPSFFCRLSAYQRLGAFDERYRIASDFDLMFRFIEIHRLSVFYTPRTLILMRTGGAANTWAGMIRGNWETLTSLRRHGVRVPLLYFWRKPLWKLSQVLRAGRGPLSIGTEPCPVAAEGVQGADQKQASHARPAGVEAVSWKQPKSRSQPAPVPLDTV